MHKHIYIREVLKNTLHARDPLLRGGGGEGKIPWVSQV